MTKRNIVPAIVVAGSLFIGLGLRASAIDNPKGALSAVESQDVMLNDKVETLLRTDIGLADSRFRVQTSAGVVTLEGSVPDEKSLQRALDLASGIKGVREIRNGMVFDFPK
jgi:osmotically-inducible protein OsmY